MLTKIAKRLDFFGASVPGFNLRGEDKVNTTTGGVISFLILYTIFLFALVKLPKLLLRENPTVTQFMEE